MSLSSSRASSITWSFYRAWNEGIIQAREKRKTEPRERLWASELGKSYIDVFYALKGIEPSNDFTETALRKFEAGNIWEKIIEIVLRKMGLLIDTQEWVKYEMEPYQALTEIRCSHCKKNNTMRVSYNCLPVTGRLDFLAGGEIDEKQALYNLREFNWLPLSILEASRKIIEMLKGKRLNSIVLEIKSVSSFMFDKYMATGQANPNHKLQLMHYLLAKNLVEGHIVYVSKDDLRLYEVGVFNPSSVKTEYENFVKEISKYYYSNEVPQKEQEVVFDEALKKFNVNWKVIYSSYLTKIYKYKDREEVEKKVIPLTSSWNRVVGRIVRKEKITKDNAEKIKGMEKAGFDIFKLLRIKKLEHENKN